LTNCNQELLLPSKVAQDLLPDVELTRLFNRRQIGSDNSNADIPVAPSTSGIRVKSKAKASSARTPPSAHQRSNVRNAKNGFKCHICDLEKPSYNALISHFSLTHYRRSLINHFIDQSNSCCSICLKVIESERKLLLHVGVIHRVLYNKVPKRNDPAIIAQKKEKVKVTNAYKCHLCQAVLRDQPSLYCHMGSVHFKGCVEAYVTGTSATCRVCDVTFSNRTNFQRHVFRVHKPFENEMPPIADLKIKRFSACRRFPVNPKSHKEGGEKFSKKKKNSKRKTQSVSKKEANFGNSNTVTMEMVSQVTSKGTFSTELGFFSVKTSKETKFNFGA